MFNSVLTNKKSLLGLVLLFCLSVLSAPAQACRDGKKKHHGHHGHGHHDHHGHKGHHGHHGKHHGHHGGKHHRIDRLKEQCAQELERRKEKKERREERRAERQAASKPAIPTVVRPSKPQQPVVKPVTVKPTPVAPTKPAPVKPAPAATKPAPAITKPAPVKPKPATGTTVADQAKDPVSQAATKQKLDALFNRFIDKNDDKLSWACMVNQLVTILKQDKKNQALVNDLQKLVNEKEPMKIGVALLAHKALLGEDVMNKFDDYSAKELTALMAKRIALNGKGTC